MVCYNFNMVLRACRLGNNFVQLVKDLFFDDDGNLKLKPELRAARILSSPYLYF